MTPAAQLAASVGIIPTLKRKIASAAATDRASAQALTLVGFGTSKANGKSRTSIVSRNMVWIANQTARLRITPTTAAVMADSAPLRALFPRKCSMNGAPRKIQAAISAK